MNLIIFAVSHKKYAADVAQVREVIRIGEITTIPDAPDFVEGVINLRGRVVSLISLRKKFGLENKELNRLNRIIIGQVNSNMIGIIVDKVIDVISVGPGSTEPPDQLLKEARYLIGIAKVQETLIPIIDIERLLTHDDKTEIEKVHKRVKIRRKT